jgi:ubiquinone/menaquinone biosynthesis C-methylase UbiE
MNQESEGPSASEFLIDPVTREAVRPSGEGYASSTGDYFPREDGIVRMLRNVDGPLSLELEAQEHALSEYSDPAFLMSRYERHMAELALEQLFGGEPPKGRILDVGCGIGLLGRMYPDLRLVGVDASMTLLREATTGYALRVEASAEALPFQAATFDVVVALNMLHHVINPDAAVREFARVLKPGGTLIAVDPRKVAPVELAKSLLRGNNKAFAPTHKAFTVGEYTKLVVQGDLFSIQEFRRVGLLSLLGMGGLDALRLSRYLPMRDRIVEGLVKADQLAFAVPGVARAGLNLAARARRMP